MGSGKLLGPSFVRMNGGIIMFWMYWFNLFDGLVESVNLGLC